MPIVRYDTEESVILIDPFVPPVGSFVDDADREPLLDSLERVAELPIERVIVPHCEEPAFLDGRRHVRAAVAEARAGR